VSRKTKTKLIPTVLAAFLGAGEVGGLERAEVIAEWATSESPVERLAIARALGAAAPAIGVHSAIELLARDAEPDVRLAAAEAAWLRRIEDPERMTAVLRRLLDDPDPAVRARAELALGRDVE
jgi:HEAT repeat protein